MIVIATNNGHVYLKELLDSMKNIEFCGEQILVVDTISTDDVHLNFLNELNTLYPELNITVTTTPYRKFDTGAYIYAYKNYKSDVYIFLHDSTVVKNNDFIKDVKSHLNTYDVVCYNSFNFMGVGGAEWNEFFKKNTGEDLYNRGIFGPMFACTKTALDKIDFDKLELPTTKNQQACYEGIWYTLFEKSDSKIFSMDTYAGGFCSSYLTKKFLHRD